MHAWRKGNAFLALLEHKKHRAEHDKKRVKRHWMHFVTPLPNAIGSMKQ
ncbi:hypothetical protein [Candidatus Symbiopectobacterium sp. 'North America']|nr:hypothetical protein [Candidatus Symbiopectobacterium sp. 'North America']